ncbi:MAG: hypothetical protein ACR2QW_16440 [bacterium]
MFRKIFIHTLAFIISPLFAGLGTGLSFYLKHPNDFAERVATKGLYSVLGPNVYVTPIAYGVVLILGVPGYLLLKKYDLASSNFVILYAAIVGYLLFILLSYGISNDWRDFVFPSIAVSAIAMLLLNCEKLTRKGGG